LIARNEPRGTVRLQRSDGCSVQTQQGNDDGPLFEERVVANEIGRIPSIARVDGDDVLMHRVNQRGRARVWLNERLCLPATQRKLNEERHGDAGEDEYLRAAVAN